MATYDPKRFYTDPERVHNVEAGAANTAGQSIDPQKAFQLLLPLALAIAALAVVTNLNAKGR